MKIAGLVLVLVLIWTSGLFAFAARVARETPAPPPPTSDGVIALTGGSSERLRAGMRLLETGRAKRLLVSGVNRKVSRAQIWTMIGAAKPLFDCCVDLDFTAADTVGNARESADWARGLGYRSIILVTADYHAPRAALEMVRAGGDLRVAVYPVATADLDALNWLASPKGARLMAREYMKYLAVLLRAPLYGHGTQAMERPSR